MRKKAVGTLVFANITIHVGEDIIAIRGSDMGTLVAALEISGEKATYTPTGSSGYGELMITARPIPMSDGRFAIGRDEHEFDSHKAIRIVFSSNMRGNVRWEIRQ